MNKVGTFDSYEDPRRLRLAFKGQGGRGTLTSPESRGGQYSREGHAKRPKRRKGWIIGLVGFILLLLVMLQILGPALMSTYARFDSSMRVARVHATKTAVPGVMNVELTLYGDNGHSSMDHNVLVQGNELRLQGDMIVYPAWLNLLGFHSGYKVTGWVGDYTDGGIEQRTQRVVTLLNGGDDDLFKFVQAHPWLSPLVQATHDKGVLIPLINGKTYDVLITQAGSLSLSNAGS